MRERGHHKLRVVFLLKVAFVLVLVLVEVHLPHIRIASYIMLVPAISYLLFILLHGMATRTNPLLKER